MGGRFAALKEHNRETLQKAVREKKADVKIIPLCSFLAETKNFFTTSSCSGRMLLLKTDKKNSKKKASFHRKWHRAVKFPELWKAVKEKTGRQELWLKQEPFILHIGTNTLENAGKMLSAMKKAGIKRGGIMVAEEEKFVIELTGTHSLALPIKINGKIIVGRQYLKTVLGKANKKMLENNKRLKKFEKACRQLQ